MLEPAEPGAATRQQILVWLSFMLEPGIRGATTSHGNCCNRQSPMLRRGGDFFVAVKFLLELGISGNQPWNLLEPTFFLDDSHGVFSVFCYNRRVQSCNSCCAELVLNGEGNHGDGRLMSTRELSCKRGATAELHLVAREL